MQRRFFKLRAQLIGIQKLNFSANGDTISGTNLFLAFPDEQVVGLKTERFFIKDNIALPKDIKANDMLEICFSYKGKIESVCKTN